jgi:UDP-N-acetylmuramate--alanine ligase
MDADHLDIYGNTETIQAAFQEFANRVPEKKNLFIPSDLPLEGTKISIDGMGSFVAQHIRIENSSYVFDVQTPTELIQNIQFHLPGRHNLMNALMALAMAKTYGTPTDSIVKALGSFYGIKRRFSYQIKTEKLVFIDDYAHHPTEINAVHQAVRELYPQRKVLAIFQPHLFSRTKDFADDFAKSLAQFDEIIVMEIYPARELPMEGITSSWLMNKIDNPNKKLVQKGQLISTIFESNAEVVVTIGAGDIGEMVSAIKNKLYEKVL